MAKDEIQHEVDRYKALSGDVDSTFSEMLSY